MLLPVLGAYFSIPKYNTGDFDFTLMEVGILLQEHGLNFNIILLLCWKTAMEYTLIIYNCSTIILLALIDIPSS